MCHSGECYYHVTMPVGLFTVAVREFISFLMCFVISFRLHSLSGASDVTMIDVLSGRTLHSDFLVCLEDIENGNCKNIKG